MSTPVEQANAMRELFERTQAGHDDPDYLKAQTVTLKPDLTLLRDQTLVAELLNCLTEADVNNPDTHKYGDKVDYNLALAKIEALRLEIEKRGGLDKVYADYFTVKVMFGMGV